MTTDDDDILSFLDDDEFRNAVDKATRVLKDGKVCTLIVTKHDAKFCTHTPGAIGDGHKNCLHIPIPALKEWALDPLALAEFLGSWLENIELSEDKTRTTDDDDI